MPPRPPPSLVLGCRRPRSSPASVRALSSLRCVGPSAEDRRTSSSAGSSRRRLSTTHDGPGPSKARRRRAGSLAAGKRHRSEMIPEEEKQSPPVPPHVSRYTFPPTPSATPPPPSAPPHSPNQDPTSKIKELMRSPDLFSPSFRPPRHTVVLCHGLYGYGVKGQIHYWANVQEVMKECGVDLLVVEVPSTGSIEDRGRALHKTLEEKVPGKKVNIVAHSMGGLDSRYLITHIKNRSYTVLSLTSIATPHRGSPVMDWFHATLGLGTPVPGLSNSLDAPPTKEPPKFITAYTLKTPLLAHLPPTPPPSPDGTSPADSSSFASYLNPLGLIDSVRATLLRTFDAPAYYNLTIPYCTTQFNPSTPDDPDVQYFSIAARATRITPLLPLWYTQIVLDQTAKNGTAEPDGFAGEKYEGNDGMVSVSSTRHGEWLGIVDDCNHWELRGKEGKLKPEPTPSTGTASADSPASSWGWSDLNAYLPSYDAISSRIFSSPPNATAAAPGEVKAMTAQEREDGEKALKNESWAVMSFLGKLVPSFGSSTSEKADSKDGTDESSGEVDASARAKKEGTEEKFELARFYRAVILNLTKNGL